MVPPFVVPYNKATLRLGQDLRDAYSILEQDRRTARIFPQPQTVAYRRGRRLGNFLSRAALNPPRRLPWGSWCCEVPRCGVDHSLHVTNTIRSTATGESTKIRHHLDCHSQNIIYVIECTKCGVQGVGETGNPRPRLLSYIRVARDQPPLDDRMCAIHKHFVESPHTLSDIRITLVDQIPKQRNFPDNVIAQIRRRMEKRWIRNLHAQLNIRLGWECSFCACAEE